MRWRDLRFEKPTNMDGQIVYRDEAHSRWISHAGGGSGATAWMPISDLPQPDLPGPIPAGWRPVDKAVDKKRTDEMFWANNKWCQTARADDWDRYTHYIVPIAPPAPQYRPFATWQEWWPHRDRWVRINGDRGKVSWYRPQYAKQQFDDGCVFLNDDGTDAEPFGVLITEATQ
jgi:hypothetical protein